MRIEKIRKEAITEIDALRTRLVHCDVDSEIITNGTVTLHLSADDLYNIISALEVYISKMEAFYEY